MKRYLLDTTLVGGYLQGRPTATALIDPWIDRREAVTSLLVYGEVLEYIKGFRDFTRRHAQLRDLLRAIRPYALTYAVLDRYAEARRALRPPQGPGIIGDVDMLIAATALERDLTVVTADSDFLRVPGLEVMLISREHLRQR